VFVLVAGLLFGVVYTLDRNAQRTTAQQAATELAGSARVAASAFAAVRADLRARAGQLATSLDLQRAVVAADRDAVERFALSHKARIEAGSVRVGSLGPQLRVTSTSRIAKGGHVLAEVTIARPLDTKLLRLLGAATPLSAHAALMLVHGDRVIAGGPIGARASARDGRLILGGTQFAVSATSLGAAGVSVLAVEPVSAIDARGRPYQRRLLAAGLVTLLLGAVLAAQLARPLARKFGELSEQAETDVLTGLANRRALDARLAEELDRARRHGTHLALVLVDVDDFKQINDLYGHQHGDEVLRALGPILRGSLRELDLAGRFGGEEFALILPGTQLPGARRVAQQIRRVLAATSIVGPSGESVKITASFGAAEFPSHPSVEALVQAADSALYEAKRTGKDRIVAATRTRKPEQHNPAATAI
jgi:diguanylate cyclase (GGDEF)-like protein